MTDTLIGGLVRQVLVPDYNEGARRAGGHQQPRRAAGGPGPAAQDRAHAAGQHVFRAVIATGNAFTYVNAWPTTRAELVLYNGENRPAASPTSSTRPSWSISPAPPPPNPRRCWPSSSPRPPPRPTPRRSSSPAAAAEPSYRRVPTPGRAKRAVANTAAGQIANRWESHRAPQRYAQRGDDSARPSTADLFGGWIVPPGGALALAGWPARPRARRSSA
jgi:hypothetical protein